METQNNLTELRNQIDIIDKELAELLGKRITTVAKVAEAKKASGTPVLDKAREDAVAAKAVENSGINGFSEGIDNIFRNIMNASRLYQYTVMNKTIPEDSVAEPLKKNPKVAVQGVKGAFAHEAAMAMLPDCEIVFCETKSELAEKIKNGDVDYGVLPVENSKEGSVNDVYDLIMKEKLYIAKAIKYRVEHCLVGVNSDDVYLESVSEIYSHMQALGQCKGFLDEKLPDSRRIPMYNTAAAARMVAGLEDPKKAAICSEKAAQTYGLKILKKGIQDDDNNTTRFIALSKNPCNDAGATKISLVFSLPHSKGSLAMLLSSFAALGLNLTKIESRAVEGGTFEYSFYLDFVGNVSKPEVRGLLAMLENELQNFFFLGNYEETEF